MLIRRSKRLENAWYSLSPEVRGFVNSLEHDQHPAGAMDFSERPNYHGDFVDGWWIMWEIDKTGPEDIIRVTIME